MKNYHHGNLKESLVNAALGNLHRGVAFEEISLRKLAKDLGVSPAAPYRHFSDNSRFLAAVAYAGFETLLVKLNSAAGEPGPKRNFLAQLGRRYLDFALANPQLYRLMFSYTLADLNNYPELAILAGRCFAVLEESIPSSSEYPSMDATGAWAYIHGLADLFIQKRLPLSLQKDKEAMNYLSGLFAQRV